MRAGIAGLLTLALSLSAPAGRSDEGRPYPWLPDFLRLQYAGQMGLLGVGTGYTWWDGRLETSANYGYLPYFVAGRRSHTFYERNSVSAAHLRVRRRLTLEPLLAGFSADISLGDRFQLYIPKATGGYYWPDALYFWLFAGTRLTYRPPPPASLRALGVQVEIGTIHPYLQAYLANRVVTLGEILSFAISAQAHR